MRLAFIIEKKKEKSNNNKKKTYLIIRSERTLVRAIGWSSMIDESEHRKKLLIDKILDHYSLFLCFEEKDLQLEMFSCREFLLKTIISSNMSNKKLQDALITDYLVDPGVFDGKNKHQHVETMVNEWNALPPTIKEQLMISTIAREIFNRGVVKTNEKNANKNNNDEDYTLLVNDLKKTATQENGNKSSLEILLSLVILEGEQHKDLGKCNNAATNVAIEISIWKYFSAFDDLFVRAIQANSVFAKGQPCNDVT